MDFNPQIDRQAEDRCHRIGQTKPVTIYRYLPVSFPSLPLKIRKSAKSCDFLFVKVQTL